MPPTERRGPDGARKNSERPQDCEAPLAVHCEVPQFVGKLVPRPEGAEMVLGPTFPTRLSFPETELFGCLVH